MATLKVDSITNAAGTGAPSFTNGITGSTSGSSPAAEIVGELLSAQRLASAATSITSGVAADVATITLTPGVWLISGAVAVEPTATTVLKFAEHAISKTSNTVPASSTRLTPSAGEQIILQAGRGEADADAIDMLTHIPPYVYTVGSNTPIYLVSKMTFTTSTATAYGRIQAVRIA